MWKIVKRKKKTLITMLWSFKGHCFCTLCINIKFYWGSPTYVPLLWSVHSKITNCLYLSPWRKNLARHPVKRVRWKGPQAFAMDPRKEACLYSSELVPPYIQWIPGISLVALVDSGFALLPPHPLTPVIISNPKKQVPWWEEGLPISLQLHLSQNY